MTAAAVPGEEMPGDPAALSSRMNRDGPDGFSAGPGVYKQTRHACSVDNQIIERLYRDFCLTFGFLGV